MSAAAFLKGLSGKVATFISKFTVPSPFTTGHDISKLLESFDALLQRGHTIVIIEHNLDVTKCADYVIDLGPEGGERGGNLIAAGTPEEVAQSEGYTAKYLKEKLESS